MKIAIIHYWLKGMRGGEKVLEVLCELYPDADIYTHVYDPSKISSIINSHNIYTTFISKLPFPTKLYRYYLPFMPLALEKIDLTKYDLVISSESGPAKGVVTSPDTCHICYCHSPMRYLWHMFYDYYKKYNFASKMFWNIFISKLRIWDYYSASKVDFFIANSENVRKRINKYYRRDAFVINPAIDAEKFYEYSNNVNRDYYFILSELVSYKKVDIAIKAFNVLKDKKLIIGGEGPQKKYLERIAGPNIKFLGRVEDDLLAEYYSKALAFILPGEEDFGITPLEAMANGTPVIAYRKGGALETVLDKKTGLFFENQNVQDIIFVINRFENMKNVFNKSDIYNRAREFDKRLFKDKIFNMINKLVNEYKNQIPR